MHSKQKYKVDVETDLDAQELIMPQGPAPTLSKNIQDHIRHSTVRIVSEDLLSGDASVCSAVLVKSNWVLTAAHCVHGKGKLTVQFPELGDANFKRNPHAEGNQLFEVSVEERHIHPAYEILMRLPAFDIALLRLKANAPKPYKPAALDFTVSNSVLPTRIVLAGFGMKTSGVDSAATIAADTDRSLGFFQRTLQVDLGSFLYSRLGVVQRLRDKIPFWTWSQANLNQGGICFGDSGGPLFELQNGSLRILGVNASFDGTPSPICSGSTHIVNVHYHKKFWDAIFEKGGTQLEDYYLNENTSLNGEYAIWPYRNDISLFTRSAMPFEIYLGPDFRGDTCAGPIPMSEGVGVKRNFVAIGGDPDMEDQRGFYYEYELVLREGPPRALHYNKKTYYAVTKKTKNQKTDLFIWKTDKGIVKHSLSLVHCNNF